jgi:hypothetical protein
MDDLDLDVDKPEDVAKVLRRAAVKYREATPELQSAWQDPNAGKVWAAFARILDRAAEQCEDAVDKFV